MNIDLPAPFRIAKLQSYFSKMNPKVGAVLVKGKYLFAGHNKLKTHTKYANPSIHEWLSIHAEMDCLNRARIEQAESIYVYRELDGNPAMARPCNGCMRFLKEAGIERIFYTIPHEPFWEMEEIK